MSRTPRSRAEVCPPTASPPPDSSDACSPITCQKEPKLEVLNIPSAKSASVQRSCDESSPSITPRCLTETSNSYLENKSFLPGVFPEPHVDPLAAGRVGLVEARLLTIGDHLGDTNELSYIYVCVHICVCIYMHIYIYIYIYTSIFV